MYAIENDSAWIQASPNAAAEHATRNNSGVINSANLAKLPDETLSSFGVRRLDQAAQSPPNTYMIATAGIIVPDGYRAKQQWHYVDMTLEQARKKCMSQIAAKASQSRQKGVVLHGYRFETDSEAVDRYGLIGSAMGAGVTYPVGGVPFYCTQLSTDTAKRVRLDASQFAALVELVALVLVETADNEDALLTLAETAPSIEAIREIDIENAWP
tara:strand:- start:6098 stop:6736 length:639 start_codon:yes stop_codon:yes gene_type:complete